MLTKDTLHQLLMAMPQDGSWMSGVGPHRDALMHLLDEGSAFVEENPMPESDDSHVDWLVRLTPQGLAHTSQSQQDED